MSRPSTRPDGAVGITGLGVVSALGPDLDAFARGIAQGRSGLGDGPRGRAAYVADGPHLGRSLALTAAREALAGTRFDLDTGASDARHGLGLIVANPAGDMVAGEPSYARTLHGAEPDDDFFFTQLCTSPTEHLARALGTQGPTLSVSNACVASAAALGAARLWLLAGKVSAVLVVGVDALCGLTTAGFGSLGLISSTGARPFHPERDGISLGEGAGALLLEADSHDPLAWLTGYGSAMDAHHMTAPAPDGRGLHAALDRSQPRGVQPDYISAHGTGTPLNDQVEATVFAERFAGVPYSSIKGAVGHTLGAAGALDAIACVLALRQGDLPVNSGLQESSAPIVTQPTRSAVRTALSVNAAFGGTCTALWFQGVS